MIERLSGAEVSLDATTGDDGGILFDPRLQSKADDLLGVLTAKEHRTLLLENLNAFRKTLYGRDLEIFQSRIMAEDPLTLQELGDRYNISRERIRQIQVRIIQKIRYWLLEHIHDFADEYKGYGDGFSQEDTPSWTYIT
jgi:RNA polymerase sigma-32 factor